MMARPCEPLTQTLTLWDPVGVAEHLFQTCMRPWSRAPPPHTHMHPPRRGQGCGPKSLALVGPPPATRCARLRVCILPCVLPNPDTQCSRSSRSLSHTHPHTHTHSATAYLTFSPSPSLSLSHTHKHTRPACTRTHTCPPPHDTQRTQKQCEQERKQAHSLPACHTKRKSLKLSTAITSKPSTFSPTYHAWPSKPQHCCPSTLKPYQP